MSCLKGLLGEVISALVDGFIPVIETKNIKEGNFNWEWYFKQPFEEIVKSEKDKGLNFSIEESGFIYPRHRSCYNRKELRAWSKVYSTYLVFNEKTREYIEKEYNTLIKPCKENGGILGVVCRGTDYLTLRPAGHPVQPDIEVSIQRVKECMAEWNYKYIYLVTEEKRILEQFEAIFPHRVITNKRIYYDEKFYNDSSITHVGQVVLKGNDDLYQRGLEYLSSVVLCSRCNALVGGNCGASLAALFLNNMKYEYWDLIDLGLYE